MHFTGAYSLALSPDGQTLIVGGAQGGDGAVHSTKNPKVTMIDCATLTVLGTYDVDGGARRIVFTTDGRAVIANASGAIDILPTGRP